MAAQEYYFSTHGAQELSGQQYPNPYAQTQQRQPHHRQSLPQIYSSSPQHNPPNYPTSPPMYSKYAPQPTQPSHPQGFAPQHPYSLETPQQYPPRQHHSAEKQHKTTTPHPGYLNTPPQRFRSHSQPATPRVRFADPDSPASTDLDDSSSNSSTSSLPRKHHRHHNHTHHSDPSTKPRTHTREPGSRKHDPHDHHHRHRHRHHHHPRETQLHGRKQRYRDMVLGAGAGSLIGEALLPGLGTAAGLVLGGYGGRKVGERGGG